MKTSCRKISFTLTRLLGELEVRRKIKEEWRKGRTQQNDLTEGKRIVPYETHLNKNESLRGVSTLLIRRRMCFRKVFINLYISSACIT